MKGLFTKVWAGCAELGFPQAFVEGGRGLLLRYLHRAEGTERNPERAW